MKTSDGAWSHWRPTIAAVGGVLLFAATLFAYFRAHATGAPATYMPLIVGAACFAGLVGATSHAGPLHGGVWFWWLVLASTMSGACFVLAVLFVMANTLGS
jgi:hypothetical protein